eukprot:Blabericola_migrator_1__1215@NODE_1310_length_4840_cov_138_493400_g882_i0_p1_GENE_NODE_1310_length_4840_cov_138_493400_g882_i0NODE_1310_length_4840_cov_138_493400_g882_i0_p1_ORF_typecomplete_len563_score153_99eIF3_zeta/PF05091_12/3_4e106NARG2_C/PF10505_9/3_7e03NARG2_C/PF10505_9/9_8e03NARG2_C/PF10505_9/0_11Med3/PF11593_8/2_2_NODE_1310_length_4840_cov_138_493400_g882_i030934781
MLVVPKCLLLERTSWRPGDIPQDALNECMSAVSYLPFPPNLKAEKLGRCCDFTFWNMQKTAQRDMPRGSQTQAAAPEINVTNDDFTLVDSSKVVRQKTRYTRRPRMTPGAQMQQRQLQQQQQQQKQTQLRFHQRQMFQRGGKKDKLGAAYQQQRPQRWAMRARAMAAEYHVEVDPEWSPVCDMTLQSLVTGYQMNPKEIKFVDVEWKGLLKQFDRSLDRVTPKTAITLKEQYMNRYSIVVPRARNDEVLTGLLQENDEVVAIVTDQLLSTLLSLPQSRYSWQIYVYRIDGKLIIEKPEASTLDLLTVNETAPENPNEIKQNRNMYDSGVEAAKVNCEFSQMALENTPVVEDYGESPFAEETEIPPARAYRYRLITLPPGKNVKSSSAGDSIRKQNLVVAVRAEVDGVVQLEDQQSLIALRALNEAGPRPGSLPYAEALERRKGDLFITELKNNACKMARWVYSAMMAGVSHIKVGFVTKKQGRFQLLQVQTLSVQTLAAQMGLKVSNAWGIVREVLDVVLSNNRGDGQYIITRDPIQSQIKIHFKNLEKADFGGAVSGDDEE